MSDLDTFDLPNQFCELLQQCRDLYISSGELCANDHPQTLPQSGEHFVQLMDDLHRALLVKVFVSICEADRHWSHNEKKLSESLIFHLWNQRLQGEMLKSALIAMSEKALSLKWYALVRPFDQIAPLRNRIGELETVVSRLANIIARADGPMKPSETSRVKMIQDELQRHLRAIPIDEPSQHQQAHEARIETIKKILHDSDRLPNTQPTAVKTSSSEEAEPKPSREQLEDALGELDQLIGLDNIKHEVRTLVNFLKVQKHRLQAGLPSTNLSLHTVFSGNPGTGKTTVARILGKVFGAMGILKQGHLVETDRSGLVAEYAGQTGPKTNKIIDESLDGVLFIDEAYTLISSEGDDPYGREAVQTLLKRMEDDRDRLVVILAGYPAEMASLLESNPGLASRFSRRLEFLDYTPLELAEIFGLMCEKNHYQLRSATRARIMLGLDHLYQRRDKHFGNGRMVRNLFEHAIRRMANRIAEVTDLSIEQLTMLEPADLEFDKLPSAVFEGLSASKSVRFHISCPACQLGKDAPQKLLGRRVRCPQCKHDFDANWGTLVQEG